MATTTPNFGWPVPTSTDLVKDGATAMEALGDAIDTSMVDLKGGTTGQVLAKASNTDMDFSWTSPNPGDITAVTAGTGISGGGTSGDVTITNSMATAIDAKGDLVAGTGSDAFARLAVGTNGQVLTADSTASTGLAWATPSGGSNTFYAGKNKIINGDFFINQRAFTSNTTSSTYNFDRWQQIFSGGTQTVTPQTFTPGTAPVSGYEGKNFVQITTASQSATSDYSAYVQRIESVRTFAGQTATVSFWAKATSGTPKLGVNGLQSFGNGGSPSADTIVTGSTVTLSTSWVRYSVTLNVPSIAGKTIGTTNDQLRLDFWTSVGTAISGAGYPAVGIQNATIQIWGVQWEAGSTATDFVTASGNSIQGELAMCQRYYYEKGGDNAYEYHAVGSVSSTTENFATLILPVQMRVTPSGSVSAAGDFAVGSASGVAITCTAVAFQSSGTKSVGIKATVASGLVAGNASTLFSNNTTSARIKLSAEL